MTNPRVESDHFVHQAIVLGYIATVSEYLAGGGSPNVFDRYDCEPLFTAVKYDRLEIAKMLLDAGGDIVRRSKFRGDAFGAACWNWNARMIEFCLEAGVDINRLDEGRTILDDLKPQRSFIHVKDIPKWQATYDKLVALGAIHGSNRST
jgi:ankyrin repeat protein